MNELRFAIRSLVRVPGFSLTAILTLALGVGATTAITSVVYGVLYRPVPYPHAERMAYTPRRAESTGAYEYYWSYSNYRDARARASTFELLEGVRLGTVVMTGHGEPQRMFIRYVTPQFLEMYSARPILGRGFSAEDDRVPGGHPVVLITHKLWQNHFGADPDIVGTIVHLSGVPYSVLGVLDAQFEYPFGQDVGSTVDLWAPAMMAGSAHARGDAIFHERGTGAFSIISRMAEGVTIEEARAEMEVIAGQLAEAYPDANRGRAIAVRHWLTAKTQGLKPPLLVLLAGALVLLLLGCFNIANLMLVRGRARLPELQIRQALGAERRSLVGHLLLESLVLALAGGLLGLLGAMAALPSIVRLVSGSLAVNATQLPPQAEVGINGVVLAVAFGVSVLAGVVFGVAPAMSVSGRVTSSRRHGMERSEGRLRGALVTFEMVTATLLLASAVLLFRSGEAMQRRELGFSKDGVLTMRISLPATRYRSEQAMTAITDAVRERIEALPGVKWAAPWGPSRPGDGFSSAHYVAEGHVAHEEAEGLRARRHFIGAESLAALDIAIVSGREFTSLDHSGSARVAIVSASTAEKLWPDADPLGRRMRAFGTDTWWTVVGVAADARLGGRVISPSQVQTMDDVYFPAGQRPLQESYFVVDTRGTPELLPIRDAVHAVDPDIPIFEVATVDDVLARREGPSRFATQLMAVFAAAAVLLAALGVYGVLTFTVSERTREIGLRSALGSTAAVIVRHFVVGGLKHAVLGVTVGMLLSIGTEPLVASLLVGVASVDDWGPAVAAGTLLLVSVLACVAPAYRATRVDPVTALRQE